MQQLIDKVIDQIEKDINFGDVTAIETLIKDIPVTNLTAFLSEVE